MIVCCKDLLSAKRLCVAIESKNLRLLLELAISQLLDLGEQCVAMFKFSMFTCIVDPCSLGLVISGRFLLVLRMPFKVSLDLN